MNRREAAPASHSPEKKKNMLLHHVKTNLLNKLRGSKTFSKNVSAANFQKQNSSCRQQVQRRITEYRRSHDNLYILRYHLPSVMDTAHCGITGVHVKNQMA